MFQLYILKSLKDNSYYIGITNNLKRRFKEHNKGRVTSTKNKKPFSLYYSEIFESRSSAVKREKYFKSLKKRVAIERAIKNFRDKIGTARS